MLKSKVCLLLAIITCFLTALFVGIFYDRHSDGAFFVKYRPILKNYFYPPQYSLAELSPADSLRERAYFKAFLIDRVLVKTNGEFPVYPGVIVQVALTFLCFGAVSLFLKRTIRYWQLPVHFLLCIVVTVFGMVCFAFPFNGIFPTMAIMYNLLIAGLLMAGRIKFNRSPQLLSLPTQTVGCDLQ